MSVHYLLDGYNISHQIKNLASDSPDEHRLALVRFIDSKCPQGSRRNPVTVVFDGRPGRGPQEFSTTVHIVFSYDISADEKIRLLVDEDEKKKSVIVVTDDRAVRDSVRTLGAKVIGVKEFLRLGRDSGRTKTGSKEVQSSKRIPEDLKNKITSEFEEIWLKKNPKKSSRKLD